MIRLSRNVLRIQESATMAISARAKAMKRDGHDVVAMAAGEPDFNTPAHIVEAAKLALDQGFTRYTPAPGIPELRAAWAEHIGQQRGVSYAPNQIIITSGGKQALFNVVFALIDPGDEVIIPAPYWVTYPEQVRAVGGEPVILPATSANDFKVTPETLRKAITDRTRLLILNSPSNPTGTIYTAEELAGLAEVLVKHQLPVVADEVYDALTYGVPFSSIVSQLPGMVDLTIIVAAMSKTYAMTGWRVGCAVGPAEVIAATAKLQSQTTSNINSIAQKAALAALQGYQSAVEEMRQEFDRRRRYMVDRLRSMPEISCPVPQGAFYTFPRVAAYYHRSYRGQQIDGSMTFAGMLLEHEKVATVPGLAFGDDGHIRLSYATSTAQIEEAMNRMDRFLAEIE